MLSIILPIFNRTDLFRLSLKSYIEQTIPKNEFEIIVVDQGSSDGLKELLIPFAKDINIRLLKVNVESITLKPPRLYGGMRNPSIFQNFGVKQSNGEFIILTSPEVVFSNNSLEQFKNLLSLKSRQFVYGRVVNAKIPPDIKFDRNSLSVINGEVFCGALRPPQENPHAYFLGGIRKQDFIELGGIEEMFMLGIGYEDTEFGRRIKSAGFDIILEESIVGIHQTHPKTLNGDMEERGDGLTISKSLYDSLPSNRIIANCGREWGNLQFDEIELNENESSARHVEVRNCQRNTILHVHNVAWIGGTGNFVYDFARCFSEFHHIALHVNSPIADPVWENHVREHMRTMHSPYLTKDILDEINPSIVMLHSTAGKSLDGEWPFPILDGKYTIAVHHTATYPLLQSDADVFVSDFVKKRYAAILDRCKLTLVVPPCIDTSAFERIERKWDSEIIFSATSAGKSSEKLRSLSINGWRLQHIMPSRQMGIMPKVLEKFMFAVIWPEADETWCRTVSECMASGMIVIAKSCGAIPEQIINGVNGFLFKDERDLILTLNMIKEVIAFYPSILEQMSETARKWARDNVGFRRLRESYYPLIVRALMRG